MKEKLLKDIGKLRFECDIMLESTREEVFHNITEIVKDIDEESFTNNLVKFSIRFMKTIQNYPDDIIMIQMVVNAVTRLLPLFIDYKKSTICVSQIHYDMIKRFYWIIEFNNKYQIINDPIIDNEYQLKEMRNMQSKYQKKAVEYFGDLFQKLS